MLCFNPLTSVALSLDELLQSSSKHEKKYIKKLQKLECYDKTEDYATVSFLYLELKNGHKSVFTNERLLDNLGYCYFRKIPWIEFYTYRKDYNNPEDIIAKGDTWIDWTKYLYSPLYREREDFIIKQKFEVSFAINNLMGLFFGIKNGIIYIVVKENDCLNAFPLEPYVQKHWEEIFRSYSPDPLKFGHYWPPMSDTLPLW
jgi:hypothetical protein